MARRRPGRRRRNRRIAPPASKPSVPTRPAGPESPLAPKRPAAAVDPLVGQVLGRCRIEDRIGQGRTAMVYRAHHEALDTTVAVKVLLPAATQNPQLVERFQTEARAIAKIDNENVVKIYDVGTEGNWYFIVMELLEGEEVRELLARENRLDVMDALRITRQAANGLSAAHARGILHRDVKPENLVLLPDGTVKLVDFGLAAGIEGGAERVGTPHFMSPETCESGEAQAASDIYGLGITLYMMLVGKPPYAGKDVRSILQAHIKGDPLHPERERSGIPAEVADLVRRLTSRDASERHTAKQAIEELDSFGGEALQEKSTLRRRSARMRAHLASKGKGGAAPLILATLLVVGAIGAVIALGSGNDEPGPTPPATKTAQTRPRPAEPTPPPRPPTPEPPPPTPVVPPPPPPEPAPKTPEDLAAQAFADAEKWARENWRTPEDDAAVVAKYRRVSERHPATEAGKRAFERVSDILTHKIHPHPEKKLANASDLAAAKRAWTQAKPEVEELLKKHLYFTAKGRLPLVATEDAGQFGREIDFWRRFLIHLTDFRTELMARLPDLPEDRRVVDLAQGRAQVLRATDQHISVRVDGKRQNILWADFPSHQLAVLGQRAFQDAGARQMLDTMAFGFAHRVWSAFWAADLDLGMRELDADQTYMLEEYRRLQPERQAGGER